MNYEKFSFIIYNLIEIIMEFTNDKKCIISPGENDSITLLFSDDATDKSSYKYIKQLLNGSFGFSKLNFQLPESGKLGSRGIFGRKFPLDRGSQDPGKFWVLGSIFFFEIFFRDSDRALGVI